jgi:hypothetical protein
MVLPLFVLCLSSTWKIWLKFTSSTNHKDIRTKFNESIRKKKIRDNVDDKFNFLLYKIFSSDDSYSSFKKSHNELFKCTQETLDTTVIIKLEITPQCREGYVELEKKGTDQIFLLLNQ